MEKDQKNIEGIVLPLFGIEDAKHIEWGEWSPNHQMCMFAPVKVDGVQYVVVQDELDGFPESTLLPVGLMNGEEHFSQMIFHGYHFR